MSSNIKKNQEIEFKTMINEDMYNKLLVEFDLEDNIFKQVNHYFDTPDNKLLNEATVLRIREKGSNFKLTKKTRGDIGADETHIFITKEDASKLIDEGFNAEIIGIPYEVKKMAELTTYRASAPYKDGTIFFDKSVYYDKVDYEIEYEVDDVDEGKQQFEDFLKSHNIEYIESIRKSKRAFDNRK